MTDITRRGSVSPSVSARGAYRNEDFFEPEELATFRDYIRPLRTARRIRLALTTALSLLLIFGADLGPRVADWVHGGGWALRLLVVLVVFEGIGTLASAPFSWWANLVYEKHAGHSTMTPRLWLKDEVLSLVLFEVVIGMVLFVPVYAAMHAFELWWLVGGLVIVGVQVIFVFLAPVLIMPRFNKFTPMEEGPIRSRIEEIAQLSGVEIAGVFLMDASKRTTRANAAVTGFGKTKRVIVNDTICELPLEQLSQVIAHELGHYRLNHIPKSFPLSALQFPTVLLAVALAGNDTVLGWAGVGDLGDPASYPLVSLVFNLGLALFGVVTGWVSRTHEREADLEALELLGDPTSFVAAWPTIVLKDKANLEPTPWELLKSTHPEIAERMQFGVDWAHLNDVDVTLPARRSVPEPERAPA